MSEKPPHDKIPLPHREYKPAELPAQLHRSTTLLPVMVGGLILAFTLIVGVWAASNNESELADVTVMPTQNAVCVVTAQKLVNVRSGPGLEYGRVWMLNSGEQRQALAQAGRNWVKISRGWVAWDDVLLKAACDNLPEDVAPEIFEDDLIPPESILMLGWGETFGENFATTTNGWTSVTQPGWLVEGALLLIPEVEFAPTNPQISHYENAYYLFSLMWESGRMDSILQFTFRRGESGAYQLTIRRDGEVQLLSLSEDTSPRLLKEGNVGKIELEQGIVVGVLADGSALRVDWANQPLFSVEDDSFIHGTYAFQMSGGQGQLHRFEVYVPRE